MNSIEPISIYTCNELPTQIDPVLLAQLREIETGTLGHIRHYGFMTPEIRAALPGTRAAGTAVTVLAPAIDSAVLHYVMGLARRGDFLIIDRCGDTRHACWGGIMAKAAKLIGLAGVVVDGPATDFEDLRESGVPVWCRGFSPLTTKAFSLGGQLNVPVSCGGVAVLPGDAIVADDSGIAVMRPHEAAAIVGRALARQDFEAQIIARIDAGESLADVSPAARSVSESLQRR